MKSPNLSIPHDHDVRPSATLDAAGKARPVTTVGNSELLIEDM